jgi:hypothetical protein
VCEAAIATDSTTEIVARPLVTNQTLLSNRSSEKRHRNDLIALCIDSDFLAAQPENRRTTDVHSWRLFPPPLVSMIAIVRRSTVRDQAPRGHLQQNVASGRQQLHSGADVAGCFEVRQANSRTILTLEREAGNSWLRSEGWFRSLPLPLSAVWIAR